MTDDSFRTGDRRRIGPGLTASALVACALVLGACGDRQKAEKSAAPASASSPGTVAAAPSPVLEVRPETRRFRDWSAACGNDGTCWAFGFAPEFAVGWVRIAMAPGPDARPDIRFGYWPDEDVGKPSNIALVVDGRAYPATLDPASDADAPVGRASGETRPLVDAMIQGKTLTIRAASTQVVSLNGASAALLWIDEKQGRLNTPTALIRRGDRPASTAPVAPPLPVVVAAPAVDQSGFGDTGQNLPAPLRARTEVGNCLKESAMPAVRDMVLSARLDARTELWGVPCGAGAYNITHDWYLTGPGGRDPRPVVLAGTSGAGADPERPDNSTINGEYDPRTRTLSAFAKGRGLGDCGALQTWTWTGDRFVLSRERVMDQCAGVPADLWPATWRTR